MLVAGTLAMTGGAVIVYSSPAAAATSTTDSVYVADYPTNINEPLPTGTPDVVTPLTTAIQDVCNPVGGLLPPPVTLNVQAGACFTVYPYPGGEPPFIVANAGNAGVALFPGCGVAAFAYPNAEGSTAAVGLAPPGNDC